jgi:hypothetical protein
VLGAFKACARLPRGARAEAGRRACRFAVLRSLERACARRWRGGVPEQEGLGR